MRSVPKPLLSSRPHSGGHRGWNTQPIAHPTVYTQETGSPGQGRTPNRILFPFTERRDSRLTLEPILSPGWRWHIRAQPPLNGVARLSPKVALEDWLAKHKDNISPESVRVVQARLDNWDQAPGPAARPPAQEPPLPWVMGVDEGQQATQEDVDSQTGQSLQAWPCAPDLFALMRANVSTERHLPRSCKAACKTLFRSLMDQAQDDPAGTVSLLLLCLPKLIWPRPREWGTAAPQGGQRAKCIHTRLQIATAGDWCQLLATALQECSRAPGPRGPEAGHLETDFDADGALQPDTARRVVASARQDCLFKAWKQIRSPPPTSCTDQVWQEATQKLQPHKCPPREAPRLTHEMWKPSPANLTEVLGRLKPRKAADAGGWTHETAALLLGEPILSL